MKFSLFFKYLRKTMIFKILFTLMCILGLIYHSSQLLYQYFSGKTVVSLEIGKILKETLPAITICYPYAISMKRAAKMSPDLNQAFEEYKEIAENDYNKTLFDSIVWKYFELNNKFRTLISSINGLFFFENLSIPLFFTKMVEKINSIKIVIKGSMANNLTNWDFIQFRLSDYYNYEGIPVESIVHQSVAKVMKCFTYFSELQNQWRGFQLSFEEININVLYDYQWFPPNVYKKFYLSIHSPNTLPDLKIGTNFLELDSSNKYLLKYSRIETELLDTSYDTNCYKYDPDYKHANFNMRSDCITDCIQKRMDCEDKTNSFFNALMRKEIFVQDTNRLIRICNMRNLYKINLNCEVQCRRDCHFAYFQYEITAKNINVTNIWVKRSAIDIRHNNLPDIVVRHMPEITFISLICNFGGLLGVWLGFNVLMVFNETFALLNKLVISKRQVHLSVNNFYQSIQYRNYTRRYTQPEITTHR